MSVASVRTYLSRFGRGADIRTPEAGTGTVEQAAVALGTEPRRIAKTIGLYSDPKRPGRHAVLIVAAGDARISNSKFKHAFGFKPRMIAAADVESLTGHPAGGVCPFANPDGATVYLDRSLQRFETVWPACGSAHSAIELTLPDLERYGSSRGWVDVCQGWE